MPEYRMVGKLIDITGNKPIPELGATYNPGTNKFTNIEISITQDNAINIINNKASLILNKHLGSIYQQGVYWNKVVESRRYIDAGEPKGLIKYPFISAEKKATSRTPKKIASSIIKNYDSCMVIQVAVEELRLGTNFKINKAASKAEVDRIVDDAILVFDMISG